MIKTTALILAGVLAIVSLPGCSPGKQGPVRQKESGSAKTAPLRVTTTFAGEDGNAQNYREAVKGWEEKTGYTVNDFSAISDESFKTRVNSEFQTGSEPDVLFYFSGADANAFIQAGKVVSIDEIREVYPEYASNMNDTLVPASLVDRKRYAVPVNGVWEALYVNSGILSEAGVEMPDAGYTWERFLDDCEAIKAAGYTPIAASLGEIPHYWWEYCIFNHNTPDHHLTIPESAQDARGRAWTAGLNDVKELYERGYFPQNTLSVSDDDTFLMFMEGEAAFLLDGSWKLGGIVTACQTDPKNPATLDQGKLNQFSVTYVPARDQRKATDLIGGLTMGYYITRKAWEDPEKREMAVDFVEYMTSDQVVPVFSIHTVSALKQAPRVERNKFNSLQLKAMDLMSGVTSLTSALQDTLPAGARTSTFDGMARIVTGEEAVEAAVEEGLKAYYSEP